MKGGVSMLQAFTRNYEDNSTEAGFQFTFYCDLCHDGYRSSFIESETYKKGSFFKNVSSGARVVGGLFGGRLGNAVWQAGYGGNVLSERFNGMSPEWQKEHEKAFERAQNEAQRHFHRCHKCRQWVCDADFNEDEGGSQDEQGVVQENQGEVPEGEALEGEGLSNVEPLSIVLPPEEEIGDLCIIDGCTTPITAGGFSTSSTAIYDGREITCYHVEDAMNLAHINEHLGDWVNDERICFKQTADIDLSKEFADGWIPIGYNADINNNYGMFDGVYLGEGHTISNLVININEIPTDSYTVCAGLFSNISDKHGHVEEINLTINSVQIKNSLSSGDIAFGGIAAIHTSPMTIKNCNVTLTGNIDISTEAGNIWIGGITGYNDGSIEGCQFIVENDRELKAITTHGSIFIGGIAGENERDYYHDGLIEGCHFETQNGVEFKATTSQGNINIGGIVGQNESVINNCLAETKNETDFNAVTYDGKIFIGGIAGESDEVIESCISNTNLRITASAVDDEEDYVVDDEIYIGGISGFENGFIADSDHNGNIVVTAPGGNLSTWRVYAGGISGYLDDYYWGERMQNCQNNGNVVSINLANKDDRYRAYAGGIVGHIDQSDNSQARSKVGIESISGGVRILNCANVGEESRVYAEAPTTMAGGIAGSSRFVEEANPLIVNCYNRSDVISSMSAFSARFEPYKGYPCTGVVAGGIIGAAGGISIENCYSSADIVQAAALENASPAGYGWHGGIAGLIWGTDFQQSYYLNKITHGIGGKVDLFAEVDGKPDFSNFIQSPVDDPMGVKGVTVQQLINKDTFDGWSWYTGGGTAPQYYVTSYPWRFIAANTYPVLRGAPYTPSTPTPTPTTPSSGGGSVIPEIVVTFMANDGTDTVVAKKTVGDSKKILLPEDPKREGYTFIGWNEKADGSSYTFTALTNVEESMTVYAQWEKNQDRERPQSSKYFKDMADYIWAILEIDELHDLNVVYGVGEELFHPGAYISRADFMTMLVRAYGLNVEFSENLPDVPVGSYYYDAIGIAKALGIAEGDGNRFHPLDPITRQDAMALVHRTLNVIGFSLDPGTDADLVAFEDALIISSYAKESIATLVKAGVINGKDGKIMPMDYTTRAEMAMIIYKMLNL
jgi:uncharacterized repeat protein (TIGR02543 family)